MLYLVPFSGSLHVEAKDEDDAFAAAHVRLDNMLGSGKTYWGKDALQWYLEDGIAEVEAQESKA